MKRFGNHARERANLIKIYVPQVCLKKQRPCSLSCVCVKFFLKGILLLRSRNERIKLSTFSEKAVYFPLSSLWMI